MKNAHLIEARYVGPTNTKGSRVRLSSHRFPRDTVAEGYDHEYDQARDQARAMLIALGYTIACEGESRNGHFFAVNEFIPLRDAASRLRKVRKSEGRSHASE